MIPPLQVAQNPFYVGTKRNEKLYCTRWRTGVPLMLMILNGSRDLRVDMQHITHEVGV